MTSKTKPQTTFFYGSVPVHTSYQQIWAEHSGSDPSNATLASHIVAELHHVAKEFYTLCFACPGATCDLFRAHAALLSTPTELYRNGADGWTQRQKLVQRISDSHLKVIGELVTSYVAGESADSRGGFEQTGTGKVGGRSYKHAAEGLYLRIWKSNRAAQRFMVSWRRLASSIVDQRMAPIVVCPLCVGFTHCGCIATLTTLAPMLGTPTSSTLTLGYLATALKRSSATSKRESEGDGPSASNAAEPVQQDSTTAQQPQQFTAFAALLFASLQRLQTSLRVPHSTDLHFNYVDDGCLVAANVLPVLVEKPGALLGRYELHQTCPQTIDLCSNSNMLKYSANTVMPAAANALAQEVEHRGCAKLNVEDFLRENVLSRIIHAHGVNIRSLYSIYYVLFNEKREEPSHQQARTIVAIDMAVRTLKDIVRSLTNLQESISLGSRDAVVARANIVNQVLYLLTEGPDADSLWDGQVMPTMRKKFGIPGAFAIGCAATMKVAVPVLASRLGLEMDSKIMSFRSFTPSLTSSNFPEQFEVVRLISEGRTNESLTWLEKEISDGEKHNPGLHRNKRYMRLSFLAASAMLKEPFQAAREQIMKVITETQTQVKDRRSLAVTLVPLLASIAEVSAATEGVWSSMFLSLCAQWVLYIGKHFPVDRAGGHTVNAAILQERSAQKKTMRFRIVRTEKKSELSTLEMHQSTSDRAYADALYVTETSKQLADRMLQWPKQLEANSLGTRMAGLLLIISGATMLMHPCRFAAASTLPARMTSDCSRRIVEGIKLLSRSLVSSGGARDTSDPTTLLPAVCGPIGVEDFNDHYSLGNLIAKVIGGAYHCLPPDAQQEIAAAVNAFLASAVLIGSRNIGNDGEEVAKYFALFDDVGLAAIPLQTEEMRRTQCCCSAAVLACLSHTISSLSKPVSKIPGKKVVSPTVVSPTKQQPSTKKRFSLRNANDHPFDIDDSAASGVDAKQLISALTKLAEDCIPGKSGDALHKQRKSDKYQSAFQTIITALVHWREWPTADAMQSLLGVVATAPKDRAVALQLDKARSAAKTVRQLFFIDSDSASPSESAHWEPSHWHFRTSMSQVRLSAVTYAAGCFEFEMMRRTSLILRPQTIELENLLRKAISEEEDKRRASLAAYLRTGLAQSKLEKEEALERADIENESLVVEFRKLVLPMVEDMETMARQVLEAAYHGVVKLADIPEAHLFMNKLFIQYDLSYREALAKEEGRARDAIVALERGESLGTRIEKVISEESAERTTIVVAQLKEHASRFVEEFSLQYFFPEAVQRAESIEFEEILRQFRLGCSAKALRACEEGEEKERLQIIKEMQADFTENFTTWEAMARSLIATEAFGSFVLEQFLLHEEWAAKHHVSIPEEAERAALQDQFQKGINEILYGAIGAEEARFRALIRAEQLRAMSTMISDHFGALWVEKVLQVEEARARALLALQYRDAQGKASLQSLENEEVRKRQAIIMLETAKSFAKSRGAV